MAKTNIEKLHEEVKRLDRLLEHPEPGLSSWMIMLGEQIDRVAEYSGTRPPAGKAQTSKVTGDLAQLSAGLTDSMQAFAELIGADLEFHDKGNCETLTVRKDGKEMTVLACGNRFDGGFFGYRYPDPPRKGGRR